MNIPTCNHLLTDGSRGGGMPLPLKGRRKPSYPAKNFLQNSLKCKKSQVMNTDIIEWSFATCYHLLYKYGTILSSYHTANSLKNRNKELKKARL